MQTPGEMLREAREVRGATLADMAAITRIPRTQLQHLESDRFEEYVAEVFVRGHIRNYARELHLDSETILQAYERHTGNFVPEPLLEQRRPASRAERGGEAVQAVPSFHMPTWAQNIRPTHMVAVALVLFGVLVMASFLTSNRATAKDPASFPVASEQAWEIEQDVEQTRWLLEQPAPAVED
ncbi:MAG: helix-turn-helix domain-containing protein [Bradymonadaceae bacterium]